MVNNIVSSSDVEGLKLLHTYVCWLCVRLQNLGRVGGNG